jgi:Ca2+-binding RTX toxin-like protein
LFNPRIVRQLDGATGTDHLADFWADYWADNGSDRRAELFERAAELLEERREIAPEHSGYFWDVSHLAPGIPAVAVSPTQLRFDGGTSDTKVSFGCPVGLGFDKSAPPETALIGGETAAADEGTRSISPGGTATGVINSNGDVDNFTITLVAGQTYMISLRGTGENALADAYLQLLNGAGTIVRASDDDGGSGTNSIITFTATTTGTYLISAAAYPGSGLTGGYTVDVRAMGSDSVGSTIGTAQALTVGQTKFGFLETNTDVDMYSVTLEAGTFYSIELAGGADYNTNPNSVPKGELDTIITIYDSAGNVVATNDDVSFPDDISSALAFSPDVAGVYYIKVDAYPQQTGGYTLDVKEIDVEGLDPLDSIDWGTQLSSTNVTVYFAPQGETYDGVTSLGWSQYEIEQAMAALQTWADVTNLTFTITNNPNNATFKLVTTQSNEFLGYFNPPGTTNAGVGVFAVNGSGWNTTGGLEQGGYGWITLVHEFGHGLGLAHPHDNGGTSTVMPGVTSPFNSFGVFDLNQGIYTTMSYNDGWQLHPDGTSPSLNYGYQGGPSAFDIALVQLKYGPDADRNSGDTVYVLPASNTAGTFWQCIWDTGGTDSIVHNGSVSAQIDLTAATLDYSATGGGVISWVDGIFGGFTIANGVVIENATGGTGTDVILGNAVANTLSGRAGADTIHGRDGNDIIEGGTGNDTLEGGTGNDTFKFTTGDGMDTVNDLAAGDVVEIRGYTSAQSVTQSGSNVVVTLSGSDRITFLNTTVAAVQAALVFPDAPTGPTEGDDVLTGTPGDDTINALGGNDTVDGLAGSDTIDGGDGNDTINGGDGRDFIHGGNGDDVIHSGDANDLLFFEQIWDDAGNDTVYGEGGQDIIYGSPGDDHYDGGTGGTQSFEGDQVHYSSALAGIYVDMSLASGQVRSLDPDDAANIGVDTLVNVEGVSGSPFGDAMNGSDGTDAFNGGDGDDTLDGLGGGDTLTGGGGNDDIEGGLGNDMLTGGDGDDVFKFAAGDGMDTVADLAAGDTVEIDDYASAQSITQDGNDVVVVLSAGDRITFSNTTVAAVQAALVFLGDPPPDPGNVIDGTEGPDTLVGTADVDTINGLGGNDTLTGVGGGDTLNGGSGNDLLISGSGDDTLVGGTGDDVYRVNNAGDVVVETAGEGIDWVKSGVSYTLGAGVSVEILGPSNGEKTTPLNFTGNEFGQDIYGNAGDNVLDGGGGNDMLVGNAGIDTLIGGTGNDVFKVGDSGDIIVEAAGEGSDSVKANTSYTLGAGVSVELMTTTNGAKTTPINLTGNEFNQDLHGNNGNNVLNGAGGNDRLYGLDGADTLIGGAGFDQMTGGGGNDDFVFTAASDSTTASPDQVRDFASGDTIDLGGIDANVNLADDQAFAFVGTSAFSNTAGELRAYQAPNGTWMVEGDTNGDGIADFAIAVTSGAPLIQADFVL